jgi:hypothetical protein
MTMLQRDMTTILSVAHLSNEELLTEIKSLAARERSATAALVASLAELDERRLYLGEGYSSLFPYCTQALHLSEQAAPSSVRKLPAARVSEVPGTRPRVADAVRLEPGPEAVPERVPAPSKRVAVVAPIAPAQYKVQITVSADTYEKLRRAQDLLRHTIQDGDPAVIFDRALTLLLTNLEKTKLAAVTRPQAQRAPARRSRHVPAAIRREVWKRDGGQCALSAATADAPSAVSSSSITSHRMRRVVP